MFKKRIRTHYYIHSAFTLVELLVVMSIISLLMSILVPSLNKVRESANSLHCRSNLRGLTLAWSMYVSDNDGKLCSPDTFLNDPTATWPFSPTTLKPHLITTNRWVADGADSASLNPIANTKTAIMNGVLWPYTQSIELYRCKSDRSKRLRSFSMSIYIGPNMEAIEAPETPLCALTLSQIITPAERMVFIDATCAPLGDFDQANWLSGPFYPLMPFGDHIGWRTAGQSETKTSRPTNRHNNGCNLSFSDLHCEPLKWQDRRTIKWINGEIKWDEASEGGNPDAQRIFDLSGRVLL